MGWPPLCRIDSGGSIRYRQEDLGELDRELACQRAIDLAATTAEYVKLMAEAPDLKVESLGERYKLLANFNGAVLAGQTTKFGIQFVTWEWSYGKQDFGRDIITEAATRRQSRTSPPGLV